MKTTDSNTMAGHLRTACATRLLPLLLLLTLLAAVQAEDYTYIASRPDLNAGTGAHTCISDANGDWGGTLTRYPDPDIPGPRDEVCCNHSQNERTREDGL